MGEGDCPCPETETLLRQRMTEIDAEMARLGELRTELARLVGQFPEGVPRDEHHRVVVRARVQREGRGYEGSLPELRLRVWRVPLPDVRL
jgi:hypothetical protein